ncbi:MAG: amidohydrolase [Bryobacteraceae bacterium]|nr:amidohydrolase [Bryobacteraceae bacterium]
MRRFSKTGRLPCFALAALLLLGSCSTARQDADWIWSAGVVLTMDPTRRVLEDGAVVVRGERIVAVGRRADLERSYRAARRIHVSEAVIAPGLINAHTHAPMSLLRGLADDVALQDWLEKYVFPVEAKFVSPDFVRAGTRLACLEMALGGVTTFADMYYYEDAVAEATRECGLRGVLGETILNFPAPDAADFQQALDYTERFVRRFQGDPLIVPAVAPHALYTNSEESLRASRALANRYGVPLLTHLAETRQEWDQAMARFGKSPVAVYEQLGLFEGPTVTAHCVWLEELDLRILSRRGVGVAHCPSSNMKLASGVAPVTKMLAAGIPVGLGTDGPGGSNNDFNLFEEMDLAAKLQKVSTGDPRALPAIQAVEMATITGARALGMDREIGSLEPGKRADLILIRLDAAHAVPLFDLYSQLVYALKASDVEHVMVNGRLIVHSGRMLTLNSRAVLLEARRLQSRIAGSVGK